MNNIENAIKTIYDFLEDIIIDKDHSIDDKAEWTLKIQQYLLRYRRIIGMIILLILVSIMYYCNGKSNGNGNDKSNKNIIQKGGEDYNFGEFTFPKSEKNKMDTLNKVKKEYETEQIKKNYISGLQAAEEAQASAAKKAANIKQEKEDGKLSSKLSKAVGYDKFKALRASGVSKTDMAYQFGAAAAGKFKEFANWLYEILFAIAISISICMIVVPSISFFGLGIICYFLLRSKMSTIKGF
jgi:hypothetical protein